MKKQILANALKRTFTGLAFIGFIFIGFGMISTASHAALFDDTEARKKIWELQAQMQSQNLANQAAIKAIEQRLTSVEAVVKGPGLADMQNQIEQLKQEVARLKGEQELASHNIDTTQQRQKDLYTDTDARGTTEYNLSLGQRRSVAVKKALNLLGVQDKQIETVSYGKEKATTCSDEDCYKLNRHADITYEVE